MSIDRMWKVLTALRKSKEPTESKEKSTVEQTLEMALFEEPLPEKRCVDLEYLLLSMPRSSWVITPDAHTSIGEDLELSGEDLEIGDE
jgi:hypothetical protein